jgi:hypothetical protein
MKTIELNGVLCVTTKTAAERLSVSERRVLQFLEEKRLQSIQIESGGPHYITVESLERMAKFERPPGRPKKEKVKAPVKKSSKKATKR